MLTDARRLAGYFGERFHQEMIEFSDLALKSEAAAHHIGRERRRIVRGLLLALLRDTGCVLPARPMLLREKFRPQDRLGGGYLGVEREMYMLCPYAEGSLPGRSLLDRARASVPPGATVEALDVTEFLKEL